MPGPFGYFGKATVSVQLLELLIGVAILQPGQLASAEGLLPMTTLGTALHEALFEG